MAALRKHPEVYDAVIPTISEHPGITVYDLAEKLAQRFGLTHKQTEKMVCNLMYQDKFVHVQATRNGFATYECYMAVPPGIEPYRFKLRNEVSKTSIERRAREQRQREKKAKEKEKEEKKVVAAQAAVAAYRKAAPKVVEAWQRHADVHPEFVLGQAPKPVYVHPKLKPFVPTINIENRDGQALTLTLEEARRMYEQLHAYFGG